MDLKDFSKIAACGVFSSSDLGFIKENFIFELAKKYNKVIVYADCKRGEGFRLGGAIESSVDNGGFNPPLEKDLVAFENGKLFDFWNISEYYDEMRDYVKKHNLKSIHFKRVKQRFKYSLSKTDLLHEPLTFFNEKGEILTQGIVFDISSIA